MSPARPPPHLASVEKGGWSRQLLLTPWWCLWIRFYLGGGKGDMVPCLSVVSDSGSSRRACSCVFLLVLSH